EDLEHRFQHHLEVTSDAEASAMTVAAWGARLSPEVDAALKQLTPEYRGPVVLIDLAGLSYDEAAGALQCPVGTVRSRLYRGRRALFAALQEYAAETGFFRGEG
ncbi:MAG TPA: sigma factor-like helix-turn-helix DNA-binding protein, partial [Gemmatimonadales bacterium]|nr:sigma factor-like helix-turn-helix DNA-binding protein [Gemmatimonadales bacterium]